MNRDGGVIYLSKDNLTIGHITKDESLPSATINFGSLGRGGAVLFFEISLEIDLLIGVCYT